MGVEREIILRAMNLPLLTGAAIIAATAGLLSLWIRNTYGGYGWLERVPERGRGLKKALVVLAAVYFVVYCWLSIHRYHKLMLGAWDLGIFESLIANAAEGRFFRDYRGPFDHFSPAVYLYLPLWAIWRDARVLLVLQTAVLVLAVWPLYLLAREVSGSIFYGALLGVLYLLYPLLGSGNLYDFHAVALSPVFFFSMLLFMRRERWRLFALFAVLLLFVKEGEAVLVFGTGLYLFLTGRRRVGFVTIVFSVVWTAAVLFVVMPALTGETFRHFSRFDPSTATAAPPAARAAQAVALMVYALLPISFLPARRWRTLVCLFVPAVAVNFFATSAYQWVLFGHYGLTVTSAALGAAALSLPECARERERHVRALPVFALIAAVLCNVLFSYPANRRWARPAEYLRLADSWNILSMPVPVTPERRDFYTLSSHDRIFLAAKDYFPHDASIAAQNNLGYFFAGRQPLFDLSPEVEADFYIFDLLKNYDLDRSTYDAMMKRFAEDPQVVRFLRLGSAEGLHFLFFAQGERWMDFYERALAAAERAGDESEPRIIVSAVEETLGLPATYPAVMRALRPHTVVRDAAEGPDEQ